MGDTDVRGLSWLPFGVVLVMTCITGPPCTYARAPEPRRSAARSVSTEGASIADATFRSANGRPILENAVLQRDSRTGGPYGLGSGTVILAMGDHTTYEFQVRDADSLKVIQRWRSVKRAALSKAEQSSALSVPAYPGWLRVDIRPYGQGIPTASSPRFAVGEVIALAGQSLAEKAISSTALGDYTSLRALGLSVGMAGAAFVAYASNTGVYPPIPDGPDVNFPPERWIIPGDSTIVNSSFAAELMLRLRSRLNVPIGLVGYAVGGTGISTWLPGSQHFRKLSEVISRAGGRFGILLWIQGHYESKNGNTPQHYMKQLKTLFSTYQQTFAGPNGGRFDRVIITIPAIGTYDGSPPAINMVRHTAKIYVRNARDAQYVDGLDATLMPDMVHPSQAGNVVLADHVYRAIAYSLGLLPYGDEGPHIASASYVMGTKVIRLKVRQINGVGGLIARGQLASQFLVYARGSQSPVQLTPGGVTIVSPKEIDLHLLSVPAESALLTVWYRESPDSPEAVGSGIYDTRVDSDGLKRGRQLWCDAEGIPVSSVQAPARAQCSLTSNTVP